MGSGSEAEKSPRPFGSLVLVYRLSGAVPKQKKAASRKKEGSKIQENLQEKSGPGVFRDQSQRSDQVHTACSGQAERQGQEQSPSGIRHIPGSFKEKGQKGSGEKDLPQENAVKIPLNADGRNQKDYEKQAEDEREGMQKRYRACLPQTVEDAGESVVCIKKRAQEREADNIFSCRRAVKKKTPGLISEEEKGIYTEKSQIKTGQKACLNGGMKLSVLGGRFCFRNGGKEKGSQGTGNGSGE